MQVSNGNIVVCDLVRRSTFTFDMLLISYPFFNKFAVIQQGNKKSMVSNNTKITALMVYGYSSFL